MRRARGARRAVGSRARLCLAALLAAAGASAVQAAPTLGDPAARFREANEQARAGDLPRALEGYRALAEAGVHSASLYWNWAQASEARGATGEALWALLRAREIDPSDDAAVREIERMREAANLDPAELAPDPLAAVARLGRRFHLGGLAGLLAAVSVLLHAVARVSRSRGAGAGAWASFAVALVTAVVPLAGGLARPTAVVAERGAPLLDAASPAARTLGALREGEVVLVLEMSGDYLRVQDSSGARGWSHVGPVRPLTSR